MLLAAPLHDVAAAGREAAPGGQSMERRRLTLDRWQAVDARFHARDGRHQRLRVRVRRRDRAHRAHGNTVAAPDALSLIDPHSW
jgi:hypothetical protein